MTDVLLKASNLKAAYGQIEVLHGVNFDVYVNEMVVILGANGAGKTKKERERKRSVEDQLKRVEENFKGAKAALKTARRSSKEQQSRE